MVLSVRRECASLQSFKTRFVSVFLFVFGFFFQAAVVESHEKKAQEAIMIILLWQARLDDSLNH